MKKPKQTEEEKRAKARAAGKKWRDANPEKVAGYNRKWKAQNPEKAAKYNRDWQIANPDKVAEYNRKWQDANPEKMAEHHRQYLSRRRSRDPEFRKAERAKLDVFLAKVNPKPDAPTHYPSYYDG